MEIEVTVYTSDGSVASHSVSTAELADQARIDEMVALIEAGTPAWLAADLTKHAQS